MCSSDLFNLQWGYNLPILSDQQIVTNNGFVPNSSTTYFNVAPYVLIAPVPETSSLLTAAAGCGLALAIARRRR